MRNLKKLLTVFFTFVFVNGLILYGINEEIKEVKSDVILNSGKIWKDNYKNYIPDVNLVKNLDEKIDEQLSVEVYLAIWCGDSQNNVPKFIKILESLKKKIKVRYFLCDRKKDKKEKFFVKEKSIIRVPTFIFYRDNKEIGRVVENPKTTLEEDALEIIF